MAKGKREGREINPDALTMKPVDDNLWRDRVPSGWLPREKFRKSTACPERGIPMIKLGPISGRTRDYEEGRLGFEHIKFGRGRKRGEYNNFYPPNLGAKTIFPLEPSLLPPSPEDRFYSIEDRLTRLEVLMSDLGKIADGIKSFLVNV